MRIRVKTALACMLATMGLAHWANAEVGSTEGSFRVDESGGATYEIPIAAVRGTAGVTPELALRYSSRAGNGIAGVGWQLSGVSSIERCRQTRATDGQARPIAWNDQDRFCLDGQRLVVQGGVYGAPGTTYRTEVDSFAVVTALGGSTGSPARFKVERKDGSVSYYGLTPEESNSSALQKNAAGQTRRWAIRRFADSVGNPIWFEYLNDASGQRISEVRYAYGSARGPGGEHAKIAFRYETRPDPLTHYLAGHRFDLAVRLSSIQVSSDGEAVRELRLAYLGAAGRSDVLSRLASVEECAGGRCLPRTMFTWSANSTEFAAPVAFPFLGRNRTLTAYELADIDGDGRLDLVWLQRDTDPEHRRSNLLYAISDGQKLVPANFNNGDSERVLDYNEQVGDFLDVIDYNGDGRQDVMIYNLARSIWEVHLSVAQGDGLWRLSATTLDTPIVNPGGPIVGLTAKAATSYADIDSDGLVDVLYQNDVLNSYVRKLVPNASEPNYSNKAYQFGPEQILTNLGANNPALSIDGNADFNGDGMVDPIALFNGKLSLVFSSPKTPAYTVMKQAQAPTLYASNPSGSPTPIAAVGKALQLPCTSPPCNLYRRTLLSDFNQDGLTDVIYTVEPGNDMYKNFTTPDPMPTYQLRLTTGTGLTEPITLGQYSNELNLQFGYDHNQDGHPDMVWHDEAARSLMVRHWRPAQLDFEPTATPFQGTTGDKTEGHFFVDVNGDGRADYVNLRGAEVRTSLALATGATGNVITAVQNGFNSRIAIDYGTLATSGHYERLDIGNSPRIPGFLWKGQAYTLAPDYAGAAGHYLRLFEGFDLPAGAETRGKDAPLLEMNGPLQIVTRVTGAAPSGDASTPGRVNKNAKSVIRYFYGEGKLQASGRGFLGFHNLRTINDQSGVVTTTTYRQDFPFNGKPFRTEVRTREGHLLRQSTQTWALTGVPATRRNTPPYRLVLANVEEQTYALANGGTSQGALLSKTRTESTNDLHDNVTRLVVDTLDASGTVQARKTVTSSYGETLEEQQRGRLAYAQVVHERGAQRETRVTTFEYYGAADGPLEGLLKTEILEPGDAKYRRTKTHSYDAFGNIRETRDTALSGLAGTPLEDRVTRAVYDADGRFVDESFNALDQRTQRVIERDALGNPLEVADVNDVRTSFDYDPFGRIESATPANGAFERTERATGNASCPDGTAFVVSVEKGGAGTSRACHDELAREIRKITPAFGGGENWQDTEYDASGRVLRGSIPYAARSASNAIYWTTTSYDVLARPTRVALPDGSAITTLYNGLEVRTTDPLQKTTIETRNVLGERTSVVDPVGGRLQYTYDAAGRVRRFVRDDSTATPSPQVAIEVIHDLLGRKTELRDPDRGITKYDYSGFDEVIRETDGRGNVIELDYDGLGRKVLQVERAWNATTRTAVEEERTNWDYDTAPHGVGQLAAVEQERSGYRKANTYDTLGRVEAVVMRLDTSDRHIYTETVGYDDFGRIALETDALHERPGPSGVRRVYGPNGYLEQVVDLASNRLVYRVGAQNARGQTTQLQLRNGVVADSEFDPATGRLEVQRARGMGQSTIQDLAYEWDAAGNLLYRRDRSNGTDLQERFCYDGLHRLIKTALGATYNCTGLAREQQDLRYDQLGNIAFKAGVGSYTYGQSAGPHAVTSTGPGSSYRYDANGSLISDSRGRALDYTARDQARRISQANNVIEFAYGPERDRFRRVDTAPSGAVTTTHYVGSLERISRSGESTVRWRRYIDGVALFNVTTDAAGTITGTEEAFLLRDHLGSLHTLTGAAGQTLERLSFDPWGLRRKAVDWSPLTDSARASFDHSRTTRGFTDHEVLDEVGIIHMNGRIYDPLLGRFLQADPFVQSAIDPALFDRYAYVRNNPLNAIDPSGHFLEILVAAYLFGAGYSAGAIAVSTFVVAFAETLIITGNLQDAFFAGISAAAFSTIGGANFGSSLTAIAQKAVVLGAVGGITSSLRGGNFGNGFLSAGLTSVIGAVIPTTQAPSIRAGLVRLGARIIAGGTVSALTGGKFANGAKSTAMTAVLSAVGATAAAFQATDGTVPVSRFTEEDEQGVLSDELKPPVEGSRAAALEKSPEARKAIREGLERSRRQILKERSQKNPQENMGTAIYKEDDKFSLGSPSPKVINDLQQPLAGGAMANEPVRGAVAIAGVYGFSEPLPSSLEGQSRSLGGAPFYIIYDPASRRDPGSYNKIFVYEAGQPVSIVPYD